MAASTSLIAPPHGRRNPPCNKSIVAAVLAAAERKRKEENEKESTVTDMVRIGKLRCPVQEQDLCQWKLESREAVVLSRPTNPANAQAIIYVNNAYGWTCGVVPRDTAAILSLLIDQSAVRFKVRAHIEQDYSSSSSLTEIDIVFYTHVAEQTKIEHFMSCTKLPYIPEQQQEAPADVPIQAPVVYSAMEEEEEEEEEKEEVILPKVAVPLVAAPLPVAALTHPECIKLVPGATRLMLPLEIVQLTSRRSKSPRLNGQAEALVFAFVVSGPHRLVFLCEGMQGPNVSYYQGYKNKSRVLKLLHVVPCTITNEAAETIASLVRASRDCIDPANPLELNPKHRRVYVLPQTN